MKDHKDKKNQKEKKHFKRNCAIFTENEWTIFSMTKITESEIEHYKSAVGRQEILND